MKSDSGAAPARPPRTRRSREDASRALVDAAAALFSERPSGNVTVREIAARAGVNPTYVHRYFGSKQALMRAAIEEWQRAIAVRLVDVVDLRRDLGVLFHAQLDAKEFTAVLARASLDGTLPAFPDGYPTMSGLVRLIEEHRGVGPDADPRDPRVVAACLSALTLGYALFGEFIRRGTSLEAEPDDWLDAAIVDVLRDIVGPAPDG